MESWNYGYDDIGESFGGNRGIALRSAVVTAAKTLKLDDIAHARSNVYLRPRAHTCDLMFPILLFERSDRSDPTTTKSDQKKMIPSFFSRDTWHSFLTIWHGEASCPRLISIKRGLAVYSFPGCFPSWNEEATETPVWLEKRIDRIFGGQYNRQAQIMWD